MDNIKLLAKNEKELENMIWTIRICSQDTGMEFGIEKCVMLIKKSGKRQIIEGIEEPNQERIRTLKEKKNYKYLGILKANTIKEAGMKEKKKKYSTSNQRENFLKSNSVIGNLSKE